MAARINEELPPFLKNTGVRMWYGRRPNDPHQFTPLVRVRGRLHTFCGVAAKGPCRGMIAIARNLRYGYDSGHSHFIPRVRVFPSDRSFYPV